MELSVLAELESIGPPVHAVRGNVDSAELQARLPLTRIVQVEGVRIAMVHDSGPAHGRLARLRRRFPEADAVVFGHSHVPLHEERDGFGIFNPGSPTERRRAPHHTMGIATVQDGRVAFELLGLDQEAMGAPPLYSAAPRRSGWAAATCRPLATSASA